MRLCRRAPPGGRPGRGDPGLELERAAGAALRRFVAARARALPLALRVPRRRRLARRPDLRVRAARRRRGLARAPPRPQLPQVRGARRRPRRLDLELARARPAPRPTDTP